MGDHARGAFEGHVNGTPVAGSMVIRMGVDELRLLITEVVQKALGGLQSDRPIADDSLISQEQVDEAVGSAQADQAATGVSDVFVDDGGDDVLAAIATSTDDDDDVVVDAKPDTSLQSTMER